MIDFFKNIFAGAIILIQSIGFSMGIKSDLPKFNPSPSPINITSPVPSSSPNPTPTVAPKSNNNRVENSNSQANKVQGVATHDGTRTGNIVKYREWCRGNQEISIYENELITKQSSDGKTYSMTQGDWDCYENVLKNSVVNPQVQTNQVTGYNYPSTQIQPKQHTDSYCKNEAALAVIKFDEEASRITREQNPWLFSHEAYIQQFGSDPGYNIWQELAQKTYDGLKQHGIREAQKLYLKVYNLCLGN